MNNAYIISTRELTIGYGEKSVLQNINVTLEKGRLVCFMGPNGSGKSTLLRTICGFIPALKGNVSLLGRNITQMTRREMAGIYSVVLTDRIQSDYMTGKELVATGRLPHTSWHGILTESDHAQIRNVMELTGTSHLADRWLYEMSDGQRQKLMIARALCQETPVIILDEPTAHLDLNNRVAIVTLLRKLAHEHGRTVLMATHELDLALQLADRLWLAEPGKTIIEGMPEDLVLNGKLDQVFQFKGYDLKSGQVTSERSGREVSVQGEGYFYLWTKNALERNGYEIGKNAELIIETPVQQDELTWKLNGREYSTLESLIESIDDLFR